LLQHFFHLLHQWHLLREFGLGVGLSTGLVIGVETTEFPFMKAFQCLWLHDGELTMKGSELILHTQEIVVTPGSKDLFTKIPHEYALNVPLFLFCVIGCALLGFAWAASKSKKITAAQSTAQSKQ
jgi:hypothetical protein